MRGRKMRRMERRHTDGIWEKIEQDNETGERVKGEGWEEFSKDRLG